MDLKSELVSRYLRILAIVTLLLGLADATRLLGVTSGAQSPIALLGPTSFVFLGIFCLARLFASVGLWIKASWGAVLLMGSTLVELGLAIFEGQIISLDIFGYIIRAVIVLSLLGMFALNFRMRQVRD